MKCNTSEFAYIDESGDDGASGSKYLILALFCTSRKKQIAKIIRNAKQILLRKNKTARWLNRMGGEIKYSGFPDMTLCFNTLKKLAKIDSKLYYLAFEKNGYPINKKTKEVILVELIRHGIESGSMPHRVIADRDYFENRKLAHIVIREMKEITVKNAEDGKEMKKLKCILQTLDEEEYMKRKNEPLLTIKMEHQNSKLSEELQALDLISGAIFSKFEHNDPAYFKALENGKLKIQGKEIPRKKE